MRTEVAASREVLTEQLVKDAKSLVDAVTMDDSGQMVGQIWVGGNGGLLSRETIKAADKLRTTLLALKAAK